MVGLEYELGANQEIGVPRKNRDTAGLHPEFLLVAAMLH